MIYAILNAILFSSAIIVYWYRRRNFDTYFIVLSAYAVTSIMCAINVYNNDFKWDLTLLPFIFLFIIMLILLYPYYGFSIENKRIIIYETNLIKLLINIYIISALLSLVLSFDNTILLIQSGEWGSLRNEFYADNNSIKLYDNQIERISKNISGYLVHFSIIYLFYLFSKPKLEKKVYIIFLCISLTSISNAMTIASRGMVVNLILEFVIAFVMFRNIIPVNRLIKLKSMLFLCFVFITIYIISVSISRFGEEEASGSALFYFSHSMLSYNDGLVNEINNYAGGKYFFKWFYDILGYDSSINFHELGTHFGSSFITFVGTLYIDFGPYGTILFAIILSSILRISFKNQIIKLSTLTLLLFSANYFLNGVFVVARGGALTWAMAFFLYFIIKIAEKRIEKYNKIII